MLLRSLHRGTQSPDGILALTSRCVAALAACQQPQALGVAAQQQQQQHQNASSSLSELHQQQSTQQQLHAVASIQQHCWQHLQLPQRHFTSSSSCSSVEEEPRPDAFIVPDPQQAVQQREADVKRILQDMPARLLNQPIFTNNLSSKIRSRKPAIKAPARHQWRFCAEDYDPMEPFPERGLAQDLPPYAPLRAHTKNYKQIYRETRPKFHRKRYLRLWRKNLAIADQRWRMAWEKKLAAARKQEEVVRKLSERIIRERSWAVWQLQQRQLLEQQPQQQQQHQQHQQQEVA